MRKFLVGVVLPIALWAMVVLARVSWKQDIHPGQVAWWIWVSTLTLGSGLAGFGVRAYWWESENQRRHRHDDDEDGD